MKVVNDIQLSSEEGTTQSGSQKNTEQGVTEETVERLLELGLVAKNNRHGFINDKIHSNEVF